MIKYKSNIRKTGLDSLIHRILYTNLKQGEKYMRKNVSKGEYKITEFRSYHLPEYFPVLLLTGEHWKISDIPSGACIFTTVWK